MSLQEQVQGNEILVPVEIKLDRLDKLKDMVQELRDLEQKIPEGVEPPETGLVVSDDEFAKKIEQHLGSIQLPNSPQTAIGFFRNPQSFLLGIFTNPYILAAMLAAGMGSQIMDWLTQHAMPFDRHFKRILADEHNIGVTREERQKTRVGLGRQVIFVNKSGIATVEDSFNSYRAVRQGEIYDMDIFRVRSGYRF